MGMPRAFPASREPLKLLLDRPHVPGHLVERASLAVQPMLAFSTGSAMLMNPVCAAPSVLRYPPGDFSKGEALLCQG